MEGFGVTDWDVRHLEATAAADASECRPCKGHGGRGGLG